MARERLFAGAAVFFFESIFSLTAVQLLGRVVGVNSLGDGDGNAAGESAALSWGKGRKSIFNAAVARFDAHDCWLMDKLIDGAVRPPLQIWDYFELDLVLLAWGF